MIKSLKTTHFRNLLQEKTTLSEKTTIFVGENGQGKTNTLEAVYLLSYGKVFRGEKSSSIAWGQESAFVEGETESDTLRVLLDKKENSQVFINGKAKGQQELFGRLVTVLFDPEEIEIVTGQPSQRRAFLDKLLATIDKQYLFSLVNYHKALKNKNFLLKTKAPADQIQGWNQILAQEGTKIWERREKTSRDLNKILEGLANKIIKKNLKINYQSGQKSQEQFLEVLEQNLERERATGISFFGPHRDDFSVETEEKDAPLEYKSLSSFGSRAEQRQGAVLLKLSQAEIFKENFSSVPTLLLDDVSSELDSNNRELLLSNIEGYQVLITTTDLSLIADKLKKNSLVLKVEKGKIIAH